MTDGDAGADADLGARRPSALLATARDTAAAPERLRRILDIVRHSGSGPRRAVLEAVASNPNAPPDVLAELVRTCPDAVRANPGLPLLVLEAPDFASLMDEARLRELLRDPSLPAALLSSVAVDSARPELAAEARMHVALAGEAGPGWAAEARSWWQAHVRDCGPFEHFEYQELAEVSVGPPWLSGVLAAKPALVGPHADRRDIREIVGALEQQYGSMTRFHSSHLSDQDFDTALRNGGLPLIAVSINAALRPDQLARLARRAAHDQAVLYGVASHPNTPDHVLTDLAGCGFALVRWKACSGKGAPLEASAARRSAALRSPLRWRGGYYRNPSHNLPLSRYVALTRGQTDPAWPAAVRRAADGDEWHERLAAAVALPEEGVAGLVTPLADDANQYVRAAARARLADPGSEVFAL